MMRNVWNSWLKLNGGTDLHAANAETQITAPGKRHIQGDAQDARQKSRQLQERSSITVNSRFTKLFILLIMSARERRMFRRTNLPGDFLSGK